MRLIVLKRNLTTVCVGSILTFTSENAINVSGAAFTGHKLFGLSELWKRASEQF